MPGVNSFKYASTKGDVLGLQCRTLAESKVRGHVRQLTDGPGRRWYVGGRMKFS